MERVRTLWIVKVLTLERVWTLPALSMLTMERVWNLWIVKALTMERVRTLLKWASSSVRGRDPRQARDDRPISGRASRRPS